MKKALADIALRHAARFRKQLSVYRAHPTIGEMHTLRIDMKAIRSLCFLLEAAGQHRDSKALHRTIRKLFARAGRIREWQLQAAWLRHHHLPTLYRSQHFPTQLASAHSAFLRHGQRKGKFIDALGKRLARGMQHLDRRKAGDYFVSLVDDLCQVLHPRTPASQWHDLRKKIKRLVHAYRWLTSNRKAPEVVRIFIGDMDALQALIGNWHDLQEMMQVLQHWKPGPDAPPDFPKALRKAKQTCRQEMDQATQVVQQKLTELHNRWIRPSKSGSHRPGSAMGH